MKDYSRGRLGDQDLCTLVLHPWTIICLGDLSTRNCAVLSYTYKRLFAWATWRPVFVHPCPIPMNDFSPGLPGDLDLCTLVLYPWTIIRLGDLATRIFAPLSYTYKLLFAWATWRPAFVHLCPIPINDFWLGYLATRICAPLSYTYERFFDWGTCPPGILHPCPIPVNDFSPVRPGGQDLCTPVLYLWTIRYKLECRWHQHKMLCQTTFMAQRRYISLICLNHHQITQCYSPFMSTATPFDLPH
jgi:hypothetical protein